MTENTESSSGLQFKVHPLVLISISDHYTHVRANTPPNSSCPGTGTGTCTSSSISSSSAINSGGGCVSNNNNNNSGCGSGSGSGSSSNQSHENLRVVGCLLGLQSGRTIDISNSFEIVSSNLNDNTLNVDWDFLLKRLEQYKTVFPNLDLVGWYSTGKGGVHDSDMMIHRKMMEITESPIYIILNTTDKNINKDLPVSLYEIELHMIDDLPQFIFVQANFEIATSDAERIGVDQVAKILPSGKSRSSDQYSAHLVTTHSAIKMLTDKLELLLKILKKMETGEQKYDHGFVRQVAGLIKQLPMSCSEEFKHSFMNEYNDALLAIHLTNMTKGTNLVNEIVEKSQILLEKPRRKYGHLM